MAAKYRFLKVEHLSLSKTWEKNLRWKDARRKKEEKPGRMERPRGRSSAYWEHHVTGNRQRSGEAAMIESFSNIRKTLTALNCWDGLAWICFIRSDLLRERLSFISSGINIKADFASAQRLLYKHCCGRRPYIVNPSPLPGFNKRIAGHVGYFCLPSVRLKLPRCFSQLLRLLTPSKWLGASLRDSPHSPQLTSALFIYDYSSQPVCSSRAFLKLLCRF